MQLQYYLHLTSMSDFADELLKLAENDSLLEVGRKAIEDELLEWRDRRLSEMMRHNGFVCREPDGTDSSVIRFGPETGVRIALKAIAKKMKEEVNES